MSRSSARSAIRWSSASITRQNRIRAVSVAHGHGTPARSASEVRAGRRPCDNRPMGHEDRFDDLIASLGGFHRSWLVYLGIELGLFARVRDAGEAGITPAELASATGTSPEAVSAWSWATDAHDLTRFDDGRLTIDHDTAQILLDEGRSDFLGGQFVHAVVASMDWGGMVEFFRDGTPIGERPDRYRVAIERLTRQDIAVFFEEVLAALPQLVAELSRGGRAVDVHCGGGRWLVAMARRFPQLQLVGVEFEPDSVARARATIEAEGLTTGSRSVPPERPIRVIPPNTTSRISSTRST